MKYYLSVMTNYAEFNGRARRKEFWMFVLFNIIITFIAMILDSLLGTTNPTLVVAGGYLELIVAVIHFVPGLAVTVRRLHDINKSGWFMCVIFIPLAGFIWLLVMECTNGTKGDNEYGPDPKLS